MKKAVLFPTLLLLSGCAVADRVQSRSDYAESTARYKACLNANPATPQACESLRMAMETDERRFNNLGAAMDGRQGSATVTVLNR